MNRDADVESAGTLSFLFTDIEGSTRMWEQRPEAMSAALKRHDEILRGAIESHGGRVFKTVGDAFCAAFPAGPQALEAALSAQRSLQSEPWPDDAAIRSRMSLHTGAAEHRNDDFFGPPLNRVARLLAVAHGGQVLISRATEALCHDSLPQGCALRDLGEHRLKDLGRPEGIFQLCHPDLRSEFPPLRSLEALPNNLPLQLTSFIGREQHMAAVKAQLANTRMLTLTGSGGCGKTRIALQIAADLLDGSGDGVWLIELASVSDPELVPQAVGSALGLLEEPGPSMTRTITDHLKARRMLVILDNCEHLLDACAGIASALLQNCPGLSILATSREALGIAGETTFRVPSLALPDASSTPSTAAIAGCEGVRLFVERASQVQADFQLSDQNAPAVAAVCRRLDGIPLAIELAAARVRAMPVEQIEQRLDQRFRLLTGSGRSSLPRQQTLRSTIDWSFNLIGEAERTLLRRLSVFSGGWTLEAAEAVCEGAPLEAWEILDVLTGLVDKSLAVYHISAEEPRYSLLESVRQYALEKLLETDGFDVWRSRHCRFYIGLAEDAAKRMFGSDVLYGQRRFDSDSENLRSALSWALEAPEAGDSALRLVGALGYYWVYGSHIREGAYWTDRALAGPESASPEVMANANQSGMYLAFFEGHMALAGQRASAALNAANESGSDWLVCASLFQVGLVRAHTEDLDGAESIAQEGLAIAQGRNDPWLIGRHLVLLGIVAWLRGKYDESRSHFQRTLDISTELQDEWHMGITLANLAFVTRHCGDTYRALELHKQGLARCLRLGDRRGMGWHLTGVAGVQVAQGHFEGGARLLGTAAKLLREVGAPLPPPQQLDQDHTAARCREALGGRQFEDLCLEGFAEPFDVVVSSVI